jgi:hypothetical protein
MWLGLEALFQRRDDARLADSRLAGDQHDLAVARLGADPAAQQQVDLLVAADQRAQRRSAQGFEPTRNDARKLYIYGYLNRVRSSRRLEAETHRNIAVIWLLRHLKPDFKTIADFRRDNRNAFRQVFRQFVLLCRQLDLFGRELLAVDGTRIKGVFHLGAFPELEDEMCAFTSAGFGGGSPNRVDALAWGITELAVAPMRSFGIFELYRQMAEEQTTRESALIAAPDPMQQRHEAILAERSRYAALMVDRMPTAEEAEAHVRAIDAILTERL